jgi:hypothetical protein
MAPFSLVTYADTQAIDGPSGRPIWSFMVTAVSSGTMPLAPVKLAPTDRAMLLDWLNAGAPPAQPSDSCSAPNVDPVEGGADPEAAPLDSSTGDDPTELVDSGVPVEGSPSADDACCSEAGDPESSNAGGADCGVEVASPDPACDADGPAE